MTDNEKITLIVTSIASPTECMRKLALEALQRGVDFYCIADVTSPQDFELEGCHFLSLEQQSKLGFRFTSLAPKRHYARKNIGYLYAMQNASDFILETDDDNFPIEGFWDLAAVDSLKSVRGQGWFNVYKWFGTEAWPRGFPLQLVLDDNQAFSFDDSCLQQPLLWQGLVAGEPDVDAIHRFTRPEALEFNNEAAVFLGRGVWSPSNSQNTQWAKTAFPLMYLPTHCSFRATDIIRSYVATRCLWELDSGVAFISPTAVQERNEHDLMKDFRDELVIYTQATDIANVLEGLTLRQGEDALYDNLLVCYKTLIDMQVVGSGELALLQAWCADVLSLQSS